MQVKIAAVRIKEMPSKYGTGTWALAQVKLDGRGEEVYELQGYGSEFVKKVQVGDWIKGYEASKEYNGVVTKTICKITAEYVYDLLMKMQGTSTEPVATQEASNDNW